MSLHSFDPEIASQVGINAAVLYQNIIFWTRKNVANGRNIRDGKVWTYNSVKAWSKLFPYLTKAQIRTALDKLVDAGLVCVGNYNETAYDRTKWYGVPTQLHLSKIANGVAQNDEPIPDSKPNTKPDGKPSMSLDANDPLVDAFEIFVSIAKGARWPIPQQLTLPRRTALKARMKEVGGFDGWEQAMRRAAQSNFLSGKATGTTPASFDWLNKQSNFRKIMEGNYDNRTDKQTTATATAFNKQPTSLASIVARRRNEQR